MSAPAPAGPPIQPNDLADYFHRTLRAKVLANDADRPRSRQTTMGASQLGNPCLRQLAHTAIGTPPRPQLGDGWAAIVGTACHEGPFTKAFQDDPEWVLPQRSVDIGPGIKGTADLLHPASGTVLDFKVLGATSMAKLKKHGPGPTYRVQVHSYGFGYKRRGFDTRHVAIAAWPRSGLSRDLHVWIEPYDEQVVEDAFKRWYPLAENAETLRNNPALIDLIPRADGPCSWCSYHAPPGTPTLEGCPGVKE